VRVALYARVSKKHGQDPDTQLYALRTHAKAKDWTVTEYVDQGWTGGKERRPQLDRLMLDADKKRFDVVLVARFDRFARSTKHLLTALAKFQSLAIDFVSLREAIDTSTPVGKLVFTILGAVAEMELSLIHERVQMGLERARQQGKKLGRPTVLVDRVQIQERAARGDSISQIAREAGIARSTVRHIVESRENGSRGETLGEKGGEKPVAD
jgi:DNA invertase Pin-like site-specific DNA recombinase